MCSTEKISPATTQATSAVTPSAASTATPVTAGERWRRRVTWPTPIRSGNVRQIGQLAGEMPCGQVTDTDGMLDPPCWLPASPSERVSRHQDFA